EKIIKKVIFKEVSLDDTEKEEERTLWLSMLPALTTIDEVKGALLHYGELEMVKLWPSITGLTGNAKIIFKNSDGIQKFKEKDIKSVFIGQNMVKVKKIGKKDVLWDMSWIS